jgi:AcrR family transcriptional regulator
MPRRAARPSEGVDEYVDPRVERTWAAALSAARGVLVSDGWDAVTHVRVSECSGLSRTTLYRYWPDRASLLAAVMPEADATPHTEPSGDLAADLRNELDGLRERFEDQSAFRVMTALLDRAEWDDDLKAMKVELVSRHVDPLARLLLTGVEVGELPADLDLRLAISQLIGPLVFRRFLSAEALSRPFVDNLVDEFLASATHADRPRARRRPVGDLDAARVL